jgi:ubiquinone biosynthesis monooxygenase Coq7
MLTRLDPDALILRFDRALRTLFGPASAARPIPGADLPEPGLNEAQRRHAASLMRVNHTGEVCAQALYEAQSLTARDGKVRALMQQAAREETDHLAWTAKRVKELGGRLSALNPVFYGGAFAIGALAGLLGDRWSLGFLGETERQVEGHLAGHLDRLPQTDQKSRAIVDQMKQDEANHGALALEHGGEKLPGPVRAAMRVSARVMTATAYWI